MSKTIEELKKSLLVSVLNNVDGDERDRCLENYDVLTVNIHNIYGLHNAMQLV